MALPQRRDPNPDPNPNDPQRDPYDRERRIEREGDIGAGWWFAWWWIWVLIIVIAIWFAGWGWGGYGGWGWGRRTVAVQQVNTGPTGQNVAVLSATNKLPFIGQTVRIQNVPVQDKINNQTLWVGTNNNGSSMLVVLTGASNSLANANIDQGSHVDITGTVQKAPPANQAKQQWSLNDDGANRLEREGAYIQATQVQNVSR